MASEVIAKVDALNEKDPVPHEEIFNTLLEASKGPFDPELSWRLARAYYHMATEVATSTEDKRKYFEAGLEVAKEAIKQAPEHFGGHKWAAIILGTYGDLLSTKEKIGNSFMVKEHLDSAEKIAPNDATVKLALGKWCYAVASIGFIERNLASAIFATPPSSSYDEALKYLFAAHDIVQADLKTWKSTEPPTLMTIAKCYEGKGEKEKAKEWYNKVLKLEGQSRSLQDDKKIAAERVKGLSSWW